MKRIKTTFIIIAVIATAGIVSIAFAHGGWDGDEYGGHMGHGGYMMGHGNGYGMGHGMMGYGPESGRYHRGDYPSDLSREDRDKLQQIQDKFFDDTRTLRSQIRDKKFALRDELDSANPDKARLADLQKEISKLQSNYDQKALAYRIEVRKIIPESADRRDYGYGRGYGGCIW